MEDFAGYMRERYAARRKAAVDALGGVCAMCPSSEDLEFDHVDRATKAIEISHLWRSSESAIAAELRKCQLLCVSCHEKKTATEMTILWTKPIKHGTLHAYLGKKCRCETCKTSYAEARKKYRSPAPTSPPA